MKQRGSGFTLLELMAVVVILAIAAMGASFAMSSINDFRLTAAMRSVMSDAIFARSHAIATQQPAYIIYTPGSGATPDQYVLQSPLGTPLPRPGAAPALMKLGTDLSDLPTTRLGMTEPLTLGFDLLGQPFTRVSGTDTLLTNGLILPLKARNGSLQMNFVVRPFTGEIIAQ